MSLLRFVNLLFIHIHRTNQPYNLIWEIKSNFQRISDCIIANQVLSKLSCQETLTEYLQQRIKNIEASLEDLNGNFVADITSSLRAVHSIFIGWQI